MVYQNQSLIWTKIVPLIFLVTLLTGGFTINRFNDTSEYVGFISEPRYWFSAFWMIFIILTAAWRYLFAISGYMKSWLVFVFLFILYMAATFLWSVNSDASLNKIIDLCLLLYFIIIGAVIILRGGNTAMEFFFICLYAVAVIYAIAGILTYSGGERMSVFGGGPNVFVRIIISGIFIGMFSWYKTGKIKWLIPIPVLLLCALLSGSRGGILSFVITVILVILFNIKRIGKIAGIAGVVIVLFFIVLNFLPVSDSFVEFWNERFVKTTYEDRYLSSRDEIIQEAWGNFKEHPLKGAGLGNALAFYYTGDSEYSHNIILDILSEGGIIGCVLFFLTFLFLIFRWQELLNIENTGALVLGVFYLLASQFSGTYFDTRFMWIFFLFYFYSPFQSEKIYSGELNYSDGIKK